MNTVTVDEALRLIYDSIPSLRITRISLENCHGHFLAEDIVADRDFPPFHRVAMDGVAINMASILKGKRKFKIEGVVAAGCDPAPLKFVDACLEVMTGAKLPMGTNIVVPYEQISIDGDTAVLPHDFKPVVMNNVHQQGSDGKKGDVILKRGTAIRAPEVAVLATVGNIKPAVFGAPKIAIVTTGDELVDVNESNPKDFQIRKSNCYGIKTLLLSFGSFDISLFHFNDDQAEMLHGLEEILKVHDMLILSGGVSKGKFDFVPSVLSDLGVKTVFHKVAQRPGKPLLFGLGSAGQLVFGLPGNPVSALFSCRRYVITCLGWMISGGKVKGVFEGEQGVLAEAHLPSKGLTFFRPCGLKDMTVTNYATNGSGDFLALCGSSGFVQLPADRELRTGDAVTFFRWRAN